MGKWSAVFIPVVNLFIASWLLRSMLLHNCKYVVTQNAKREILENVDILIENDRIVGIGKGLKSKDEIIDCSQRIVMPGLINCHTHLPMSDMRGLSDDEELHEWLAKVIAAEKKGTAKDRESAAELGVREALRTGTTTVCDHYWDREASIAAAKGIRMFYFADFFTAHHALSAEEIPGMLPKSHVATISVGMAPHSIYGTDEKFLRAARAYATKHNLLLHMHVAETRKERAECKQTHGRLPVEYLEQIGFLGPDVMIAHAVWLTKGELDILAKHKVSVVHCPQSNMKLAGGGVMPLREMQERGINVALGTDSVASNNSLDMFREMHVAALLHKHHYWDPTVADAQNILDMATRNGAKALHREDLGSIEESKKADIVMLDATDANLQPVEKHRLISHITYAANGFNVAETIVDGKLLLREKRLLS
jgi:5-methylthioadenosine/S-adenosylhomocysteine deaminase